jgi:ketosteroid isomerase-like protein
MSQENVELVRAAFDAWNRGDLEAWTDSWDERAEFYPLRAQLEGHGYHGRDGLRRFVADMAEEWDEVRFDVDEVRDAGEQMVALGRVRARGRASGVELNVPLAVVGVTRRNKIVYARFYSEPADAFEAAGLEE